MSRTLGAGVGRRTINPPLGIMRNGQRLYGDAIEAIESDLTATVCVLSDGLAKVAVLALDLCRMTTSVADALRAAVAETIDTEPSHVMLNVSHNHSSPGLPGDSPDLPEQRALKELYLRDLSRRVSEAAADANASLRPARIGSGWGSSDIGVYRREVASDGRDVLGEVPSHPIDQSVGVIRIDELDGQPIAIMFSYGCHAVVVGPRAPVAATDYPGPARRVVETCLGGTALFLQACGGNINPRVGIGYEIDSRDNEDRVGTMLGAEALRVASGIRTHVEPGERRLLGHVPNILFRTWEPVRGATCTFLGAAEESVELQYMELPSLHDAVKLRVQWERALANGIRDHAADWEIRVARKFRDWAVRLVAAVENGGSTHELRLQAIRVNDIVLAGMSMETFFETGVAIKEASPVAHTQVLGYTNGLTGYLPRKEDYPSGGWQLNETYNVPDLYVQAYLMPVALQPDAERVAVDRVVELIRSLT
jgi:neutral ceramidase